MATARAEHAKPKDDAHHSGRLLLRLPPAMHSELAQAAERECTSLNAYITQALSASLSDFEALHAAGGPSRFMRIAVIIDLVIVGVATLSAVALLIAALP